MFLFTLNTGILKNDNETDELHRELQGHTSSVCVIISEPKQNSEFYASSQRLVFSGSNDWTIRVWNASGTCSNMKNF